MLGVMIEALWHLGDRYQTLLDCACNKFVRVAVCLAALLSSAARSAHLLPWPGRAASQLRCHAGRQILPFFTAHPSLTSCTTSSSPVRMPCRNASGSSGRGCVADLS